MSILYLHPLSQIWNEVDRAQNRMNRLFQYGDPRNPAVPALEPAAYPLVNVWDDDESIYLEAELPGITLADLEITITDGNRLTLMGQRKPVEVAQTTWHRQERSFGSFNRTLTLPLLVESDRVEAQFELGVLRVKLPKSPKAKPRHIEVTQSSSAKQNHKKGKNHVHAN